MKLDKHTKEILEDFNIPNDVINDGVLDISYYLYTEYRLFIEIRLNVSSKPTTWNYSLYIDNDKDSRCVKKFNILNLTSIEQCYNSAIYFSIKYLQLYNSNKPMYESDIHFGLLHDGTSMENVNYIRLPQKF